jgi:hypothetical protein
MGAAETKQIQFSKSLWKKGAEFSAPAFFCLLTFLEESIIMESEIDLQGGLPKC